MVELPAAAATTSSTSAATTRSTAAEGDTSSAVASRVRVFAGEYEGKTGLPPPPGSYALANDT